MAAFDELVERLTDGSTAYYRRADAARALGRLGDERAVTHLIAVLSDDERYVRRDAVSALGELRDERALEPLVGVLEKDDDDETRRNAVRALGAFAGERALEAVNRALEDNSWSVRYAAKDALRKIQQALAEVKGDAQAAQARVSETDQDAPTSPPPAETEPAVEDEADRTHAESPAIEAEADDREPAQPEPEHGAQLAETEVVAQELAAEPPAEAPRETPEGEIESFIEPTLRFAEVVQTLFRSSRSAEGRAGESWLAITNERAIIVRKDESSELSLDAYGLGDITGTEIQYFSTPTGDECGGLFMLSGDKPMDCMAFSVSEKDEFEAVAETLRNARQAPSTAAEDVDERPFAEPVAERHAPASYSDLPARAIRLTLDRQAYGPGEVVRGEVVVKADTPLRVRGVRLSVFGVEKTSITTGSGKSRSTHRSKQVIIDQEITLFGGKKTSLVDNIGNAMMTLFGRAEHATIPPGAHRYPFQFTLPQCASPSYQGINAEVNYSLRAYVDIPAGFDLVHRRTLRVDAPPLSSKPGTATESRSRISLAAAVDGAEWALGETLSGRFSLENPTGRKIRAVLVSLVCQEHAEAEALLGNVTRDATVSKLSETVQLAPTDHSIKDRAFALPIPSGPPPFRGRWCQVSWAVEVQLDVAWAFDVKVRIPIREQ